MYIYIYLYIYTHTHIYICIKAFIFFYHFLDFYKEQEKMGRSTISFVTNFLFIRPFAFTFQRSFCEKSLLNAS